MLLDDVHTEAVWRTKIIDGEAGEGQLMKRMRKGCVASSHANLRWMLAAIERSVYSSISDGHETDWIGRSLDL